MAQNILLYQKLGDVLICDSISDLRKNDSKGEVWNIFLLYFLVGVLTTFKLLLDSLCRVWLTLTLFAIYKKCPLCKCHPLRKIAFNIPKRFSVRLSVFILLLWHQGHCMNGMNGWRNTCCIPCAVCASHPLLEYTWGTPSSWSWTKIDQACVFPHFV